MPSLLSNSQNPGKAYDLMVLPLVAALLYNVTAAAPCGISLKRSCLWLPCLSHWMICFNLLSNMDVKALLKNNHITIVQNDTVKIETLMLVQKVFHTIVFTYIRSYHAMNFRSCVARKALNFLTTLVRFFRTFLISLLYDWGLYLSHHLAEIIFQNHFTMFFFYISFLPKWKIDFKRCRWNPPLSTCTTAALLTAKHSGV